MGRRRMLGGNRGDQIPQDFLVSEYRLEETSGTVVNDSTGNNNGTHSDIPSVTSIGKVGNGFKFGTTERNILVPYSTDFIFNNGTENLPFSLCFWDKPIIQTSTRIFARWYVASTYTLEFAVGVNFLGLRVWNQDGSIVDYKLTTASDYPSIIGEWDHLGVVFDPAATEKCKILINGQSKAVTTSGTLTNIRVQNHTLRLGGLEREGVMDEVKIYKKALSNEEMLSIYNTEL